MEEREKELATVAKYFPPDSRAPANLSFTIDIEGKSREEGDRGQASVARVQPVEVALLRMIGSAKTMVTELQSNDRHISLHENHNSNRSFYSSSNPA